MPVSDRNQYFEANWVLVCGWFEMCYKKDKIDEESQTIYNMKGKIFSWNNIAYK